MISKAKTSDKNEIISLWKESFGDSESYIERFLERFPAEEHCLVYKEGSELCSMLFLLDGQFDIKGTGFDAYYVYAACTSQEHQNRGLMTRLMDFTAEYAKDTGMDFLCLTPANEPLFNFYAKFGFKRVFKRKVIKLPKPYLRIMAKQEAHASEPDIQTVIKLRELSLANTNYFRWKTDVIEYSLVETKIADGLAVFAEEEGILTGYAFGYITENVARITECCVLPGEFSGVASLLAKLNADEFEFSLPVDFPLSADKFSVIDNSMALPLTQNSSALLADIKNAYFGITLE